jgi:uncharacterized protein (TIGR02246 family)
MKSVYSGAVLLALVGVAVAAPQPAKSSQRSAAGTEAITAVADAYTKAALAGDAKAIAALYTEDAVEMPPHEAMVKGRPAILQYYEKQFGMGSKMNTFTVTHLETYAAGDRAYDVGTYTQSVTPKGATAPVDDTGKYTVILKRVGNAWLVAYAIYNSDQPLPQR